MGYCETYNLSFYHSTSGFHLPGGINEERNGQENSVDNQVVALQQALAMMQMGNMLENGPSEETGTKKKSGIPTLDRCPYFILGVEITVKKLSYSFETLENSMLFQMSI